jgi:CRISPR-associated protein Cas2
VKRRRYVVAYDIRDDTRLRQVHKAMKSFGDPLQYSVFVCDLDPVEKLAMRRTLGEIVHFGADSIAIIDLGDAEKRGSECFEFMGPHRALPFDGPRIV